MSFSFANLKFQIHLQLFMHFMSFPFANLKFENMKAKVKGRRQLKLLS